MTHMPSFAQALRWLCRCHGSLSVGPSWLACGQLPSFTHWDYCGGDHHSRDRIEGTKTVCSVLHLPVITSTGPEVWPVPRVMGILLLSIKLYRQPVRLLPRRVLRIPPSEPRVATLSFGMGSCDLPRLWTFEHSCTPVLGTERPL